MHDPTMPSRSATAIRSSERVDVDHPVREVHALQASLVEDVRVGRAARAVVDHLVAAALERPGGEHDRVVALRKAVAAIALPRARLDLAVGDGGGERDGVLHLADQVGQLVLVVRAGLGVERAPLGDDVRRGAAGDRADVRRRVLVDPAEPELGDRTRRGGDRRAPVVRDTCRRAQRGRGTSPRATATTGRRESRCRSAPPGRRRSRARARSRV